jgi:hypothetical protein
MSDEPGAKSCDVLVAVKGVRFRRGVDRNGMRGRRIGWWCRMGRGRQGFEIHEKMGDEPGAKLCDVLVALKGVRFRRGVDRNGMSGRRVGWWGGLTERLEQRSRKNSDG